MENNTMDWTIGDHLENFNNPHEVTKEQVDLGNVENVRQYSELNPPPRYINTVCGKKPDANGDIDLVKGDVNLGKVDNVKQYSEKNPPPYPVTSVNGMTGAVTVDVPDISGIQTDLGGHIANVSNPHGVTKGQIGLGNVPDVVPYHVGNKPSKADVGLGNVDNTADLNKPVSIAVQNALNEKVNKINGKGLSTNDFSDDYMLKIQRLKQNFAKNVITIGKVGECYAEDEVTYLLDTSDDIGVIINDIIKSSGGKTTIFLRKGMYSLYTKINIDKDNIELCGEDKDEVIIAKQASEEWGIRCRANNIFLYNFTLREINSEPKVGIATGQNDFCKDLRIKNMKLEGFSVAISLIGSGDKVTIENNEIKTRKGATLAVPMSDGLFNWNNTFGTLKSFGVHLYGRKLNSIETKYIVKGNTFIGEAPFIDDCNAIFMHTTRNESSHWVQIYDNDFVNFKYAVFAYNNIGITECKHNYIRFCYRAINIYGGVVKAISNVMENVCAGIMQISNYTVNSNRQVIISNNLIYRNVHFPLTEKTIEYSKACNALVCDMGTALGEDSISITNNIITNFNRINIVVLGASKFDANTFDKHVINISNNICNRNNEFKPIPGAIEYGESGIQSAGGRSVINNNICGALYTEGYSATVTSNDIHNYTGGLNNVFYIKNKTAMVTGNQAKKTHLIFYCVNSIISSNIVYKLIDNGTNNVKSNNIIMETI